jgi:hypothetical protein
MSVVTATVVVNFTDNASAGGGILTAEIDGRPAGFNGGKSSFVAGDSPVILIYRTTNVVINSVIPSTGVMSPHGSGTSLETQDLQFATDVSATLDKPITGSLVSTKWLGRDLGTLSLTGEAGVRATGTPPGIARVTYNATYQAYRLSNVVSPLNGETVFPVVIVVTGTSS